jgi:hypothetical protein
MAGIFGSVWGSSQVGVGIDVFIQGKVMYFADLPSPVTYDGQIFLVLLDSGAVPNTKRGGLYYATGGVWDYLGEATNTLELDPLAVKAIYESNPDTNAFTDALKAKLIALYQPNAAGVPYSNTTSGYVATNVQAAIDEAAANINNRMLRSLYDANNNGIVDNSERLNNQLPSFYLARANHTGTQAATTVTFNNAVSGLIATQVQAAIDALDAIVDNLSVNKMERMTYDANNNGIVDNAEALNGQTGAYYLNRANHTGTEEAVSIAYSGLVSGLIATNVQQAIDELASEKMDKSVYDTDDDGIVNDSELFNSQAPAFYLSRTNHTDSQPATSVSFDNTGTGLSALNVQTAIAELDSNKMLRTVYDANNNGIVDDAEQAQNALLLNGNGSGFYLSRANHTGTQIAATISDFDAEVSNNADVAANTAARHTHANKAQLDLITDGDHDVRLDNPHNVTKAQVGLGNVDNTSDANKPISTATQAALDLKADLVAGKVPASQLPSYVDDVEEYANLAAFPITGETGKIYVDVSLNRFYRWTGSSYVQLGTSVLPTKSGEVAGTSFAGNPKTATVTFTTPFADAAYSVSIIGQNQSRAWEVENKTAAGFVIQTNANAAITNPVLWIAIKHGET